MQSQARRRTTYGINVTVAIVAAIALTVLVNWLVYRKAWKLDLSAGRKYTLSAQTLNVLRDLNGEHQIVTLFGEDDRTSSEITQRLQSARDLVDEYARYSSNVHAQHINVTANPQGYETFLAGLHDRYTEKLAPVRDAIEQAQRTIDQVRGDVTGHLGPLKEAIDNPAFTDTNAKRQIEAVASAFASLGPKLEDAQKTITEAMRHTLPHYSGARNNLTMNLTELSTNLYGIAIERFERIARSNEVPSAVKETLLASIESFKLTMGKIQDAVTRLQSVPMDPMYDRLRLDVNRPDPIVLVGPREVRVLALHEMFRQPPPQRREEDAETEPDFQGEERLTGALVSMTLENPPLVVFVTDSALLPLSSRGADAMILYTDVAQRLENMNFEVTEWSPAGGRNPMGQPRPATPPPTPKTGQKAIWVVLPATPVDPRNPMAAGYRDQVAAHLKKRMEAGDAIFFMFGYNHMAPFGEVDPVAELLQPFGVTPQLDRVVFREIALPNRPPAPVGQFIIDSWGGGLPIGGAIDGMPGTFVQVSPLVVGKAQRDDVTTHILATARAGNDRMWAATEVGSTELKYDEATAADHFHIAAAIEAKDQRFVVVSDPVFASNFFTTNADARLSRGGVGLAPFFGAAYPGNAELFINSVFWLSDLDVLIAASARTQDVRRIRIEPDSVPWLSRSLMAGMPLGTLVIGLAVWRVRRRE